MSILTIPSTLTSPRDDAANLHKAFKGIGCDTSKIISILAHRDSAQRDLIQQEYETAFNEKLSKRISSELHGNVKKAVLLWLPDPPTRDAKILRQSLTDVICDKDAITEVICSRTPSQIRRFKDAYSSAYHSELMRDIESKTSGDHKKLMLAYLSTQRYEGPELDHALVHMDAQELYKSRKNRTRINGDLLIRMFSERSSVHLAAVSYTYEAFGYSLQKTIKDEISSPLSDGLLTILQCSTDPAMYFAKILRKSMKGIGTDDGSLVRVIVTRTEVDMEKIKTTYYSKYNRTLADAIHSDTTGNYRDFLLQLIGSN